jgi:hypothetical protein
MVWPIIRGKSYLGETVKSMKVGEIGRISEGVLAKITDIVMESLHSLSRAKLVSRTLVGLAL